jgi:hypothetical protein
MAEQVNVCIKNSFLNENIEVFRELPDGTPEPGSNVTIAAQSDYMVLLQEPGMKLIITPNSAVDFGTCWYNVTKNEHLVLWEPMSDHWRVQMAANDTDPEVPLDVNVEVGGDPP